MRQAVRSSEQDEAALPPAARHASLHREPACPQLQGPGDPDQVGGGGGLQTERTTLLKYFFTYRKILRILDNLKLGTRPDQDLKEIDNFLEANLDAKLVQDEVEINRMIDSLPEEEFIAECRKDFSQNKI